MSYNCSHTCYRSKLNSQEQKADQWLLAPKGNTGNMELFGGIEIQLVKQNISREQFQDALNTSNAAEPFAQVGYDGYA